ncbi:MAG: hypothetical protein IPN29_02010 [Saprospiraceae bacterium]|nr:hypothetical protein [Saprospiraceae bacterium]
MSLLLNKEVRITNSRLIRWADENDVPLSGLERMKITQMISLISYCSDLTEDEINNELDKDIGFTETLVKTVTDSLELRGTGELGKPKARPMRKK